MFFSNNTSSKTNMDTQNDGLEEVNSFKIMAIFGIDSIDFREGRLLKFFNKKPHCRRIVDFICKI